MIPTTGFYEWQKLGKVKQSERRTQETGSDLFRLAREAHVGFSVNRWLDERFMSVTLHSTRR